MRAPESRSSTRSCTADYYDHSSKQTNLLHPSSYVAPSAPSTTHWMATSWTHDSGQQPETCHKIQRPVDQEGLGLGQMGLGGQMGLLRIHRLARCKRGLGRFVSLGLI